jgi:hypothetical protein
MSATLRCVTGAALMSSVVGGLAYATAERECEQQQENFRAMAQEECLANDPSSILNAPENATVQDELYRLRRLHSLHEVCAFGMAGDPLRATHAS